jgi:hypothetical protein
MAVVIPPACYENAVSAAEKRVSNLLKHDAGISRWTVLHSPTCAHRDSFGG